MNRRSFFRRIVGAVIFSKVLPAALARVPAQPEVITMRLVSTPVVAKVTKLKAVWTVEYDQHLCAWYNLEVEKPLVQALDRYACEPL